MKSACVLVLAACGAGSTYRSTGIVPAGQTQWLAGLQASGVATQGIDEAGQTMDRAAPLPELAIGARRGFEERFELQLNGTLLPTKVAQTGSLELAGKMRFWQDGRWSLAAGAAVGYRIAHAGGALIEVGYATLPLIGGVDLGAHQLVLSIDGGYQRVYSSGAQPVDIPSIGQTIGFRWQVADAWALLPEVGTAWTPVSNAFSEQSRLFHVGIAALWTR